MRSIQKVLIAEFLLVVASTAVCAQTEIARGTLSPAQKQIAQIQTQIEKNPQRYQAYNQLAMVLARRARETSDTNFYSQAEAALEKSFALSPENLEGMKAKTWLLLGKHEFAKAAELAKQLNQRWPDDIIIYGYLTDANAELGNYSAAEQAAQWMLDLRPANVPGLTRAAYLRELFGDIDGAMELMEMAFRQTAPTEVEDRAWILTQLAHLNFLTGKLDSADKLLQSAMALFPNYHYALANLAKVRAAQGRQAEAAEVLRLRYQSAPHAENAFDLGVALMRAGKQNEAKSVFAEFEAKARKEMSLADNANRELIFYYTDYAANPREALRIAELEAARRHDIYTLDAYAWALSANGRHADARKQIDAALAVGIRDAQLFYHAGVIAERAGERGQAAKLLKQSIELNPSSEFSAAAQKKLIWMESKAKKG